MIDKKKILRELEIIFKKIFRDKNLTITNKTKREKILEWDSLGTVKLIIVIEKKFKIRITPNESIDINNVHSLINIISKKISKK